MMVREKVILASASASRAEILRNAGLDVDVKPALIDEETVKQAILSEDSGILPSDFADLLAQAKASSVSENEPGFAVIGGDQVLVLDGTIFDKPKSKDEARDQLVSLRGKTHELISAICVARHGTTQWSHISRAQLTMRDFSNEFLGYYLAAMGDSVTETVGGYKLEGEGAQLFDKVEGDYFTVLGLPLMPLLSYLRSSEVLYV